YLAIDAFSPGSIQIGSHPADRQTELLYFSLLTLSTIGYGDIVPISGEARVLAALEGVTGVLYIAITVAVLVGRFRSEFADQQGDRAWRASSSRNLRSLWPSPGTVERWIAEGRNLEARAHRGSSGALDDRSG